MGTANQLYQILPALYRYRDEAPAGEGHLKAYLEACGALLDQFHATLRQRMADNFPEPAGEGGAACQEWLIPYFAELLDVRLVSPTAEGRRAEVANAVSWRQGKGTLSVVEAIAEAIAQLEVVTHEGWHRVAVTSRLDTPLLPASSLGAGGDVQPQPQMAARHPGLAAVTPDLRCPSRAVASDTANAAGRYSKVEGGVHLWRQVSRHGVPCYPDSYEDVSRRTVDLRKSDWRVGHYHPRKALLYSLPPVGFFPEDHPTVNWTDPPNEAFLEHVEIIEEEGRTTYRNRSLDSGFLPVKVRHIIKLGQTASGVGDPDFHRWRFEGLVLDNLVELDSGRIELERCAARRIEAQAIDTRNPVIDAVDCLFKYVQAARGLVRLDYCTVLEETISETMQASDCIFLRLIQRHHPPVFLPPDEYCVRHSRISPSQDLSGIKHYGLTTVDPIMFSSTFGERGCGVLHPACPTTIRRGAEDGGEMGAFHDRHFSLLADAVVDKLRDYLPVGQEAVYIPDPRLVEMPGKLAGP